MADIHEARALQALATLVQVGDRAYSTQHDYIADSREEVVTSKTCGRVDFRLDKPVHSQGRAFRTSYLMWPDEDQDYEVDLVRRVLRIYRQSYGSRVIAVTIAFSAAGPDGRDDAFRWCGTCGGRVAYSAHTAH